MSWQALHVEVNRSDMGDISDRLWELGCSGIEERFKEGETPAPRQPWDTGPKKPLPSRMVLVASFDAPDRDAIDAELTQKAEVSSSSLRWVTLEEVDWEQQWRDSFHPIEVSPRITIAPPWNAPANSVIIEPGQGFGTGEHPTTQAVIRQMDPLISPDTPVLDIGCGSGILAIAAAKLGATAVGFDVELAAVEQAKENAKLNNVDVSFSSQSFEHHAPAELVLANLHAELLVKYGDDIVRLASRHLILAGILLDRESTVRARYDKHFDLIHRDLAESEWVCLHYRIKQ